MDYNLDRSERNASRKKREKYYDREWIESDQTNEYQDGQRETPYISYGHIFEDAPDGGLSYQSTREPRAGLNDGGVVYREPTDSAPPASGAPLFRGDGPGTIQRSLAYGTDWGIPAESQAILRDMIRKPGEAVHSGDHGGLRDDQYNAQSYRGKRVLTHELPHVVQQSEQPKIVPVNSEKQTIRRSPDEEKFSSHMIESLDEVGEAISDREVVPDSGDVGDLYKASSSEYDSLPPAKNLFSLVGKILSALDFMEDLDRSLATMANRNRVRNDLSLNGLQDIFTQEERQITEALKLIASELSRSEGDSVADQTEAKPDVEKREKLLEFKSTVLEPAAESLLDVQALNFRRLRNSYTVLKMFDQYLTVAYPVQKKGITYGPIFTSRNGAKHPLIGYDRLEHIVREVRALENLGDAYYEVTEWNMFNRSVVGRFPFGELAAKAGGKFYDWKTGRQTLRGDLEQYLRLRRERIRTNWHTQYAFQIIQNF